MVKKIAKKLQQLIFGKKNARGKEPIHFTKRLKAEIGTFKTVFDIGTFKGNFIDEILHINAAITIHCFEPSSEAFDFLNLKFSQQSNIRLNNAAVSDYTGEASFNVNAFDETNSLLESASVDEHINNLTQKKSTQTVDVVKLSEYCLQHGVSEIDLIKIDTQGNSYNVLKGLEPLLKEKKIKYLYVEAEFIEIYKNEKLFSEIEMLMRGLDYAIMDIYNLNYLNKERLAWCDVLFAVKK